MKKHTTYSNKGLYNGYDKNHRERSADDYYSTPSVEVVNILERLNIDLSNKTILEPCVGGGHLLQGILTFTSYYKYPLKELLYSDIKDRGYSYENSEVKNLGLNLDFLSDDYPFFNVDYVIMNPPYKLLEPFMVRSFEIATKGIIVLCRLQALEGDHRYKTIFKENPPSEVYVYVDRIKCLKNGIDDHSSSAQAYAWFYWDLEREDKHTYLYHIFRK